MEVIARPRGKGKTQYLLNLIRREPNGVMLVRDVQNRDAMRRQNPELHNKIFTYQEQRTFLGGMSRNDIWIDDIEQFVQQMFPNSLIHGFTVTGQSDNGWDK